MDTVRDMVGGTATIFEVLPGKLLRVSTNVKKLDGTRATGTYISSDSPVYQTVMAGRTFYGKAYVVNAWYLTAYKPLRDAEGNIVSVVYVGRKILTDALVDFLREASQELRAGIYAYNSKGDIMVDVTNQFTGKNIFSGPGGKLFENTKNGVIRYQTQDNGVMKIASLGYFQPWDWHIGVELTEQQLAHGIDKKLAVNGFIILIAGIGVSVIVLWLLIKTMTRPLQELAKQAEAVRQGNFDVTFTYEANDAIGTLGKAFLEMVDNFKNVLLEMASGINRLSDSSADLNKISGEINSNTGEIASTVDNVASSADNMSQVLPPARK